MTTRVISGAWAWSSLNVLLDVSHTYSQRTSKLGLAFTSFWRLLLAVHHLLLQQINFPQNSVRLFLLGKDTVSFAYVLRLRTALTKQVGVVVFTLPPSLLLSFSITLNLIFKKKKKVLSIVPSLSIYIMFAA